MSSRALLRVNAIANNNDISSEEKQHEILAILYDNLASKEQLKYFINAVTKQQVSQIPVKQILNEFINSLPAKCGDTDDQVAVLKLLIDIFTPPTPILNAALLNCILKLSQFYESDNNLQENIDLLKSIHFDSLASEFTSLDEFNKFKIEINCKISKDLIALDNLEDADAYMSRVTPLLTELDQIEYKQLILDSYEIIIDLLIKRNKFFDATSRLLFYKELNKNSEFDLQIIKFAILSSYDPSLKTSLFNKILNLPNTHLQNDNILTKMFSKVKDEKIIYKSEFEELIEFYLTNNEENLSQQFLQDCLIKSIVESNLVSFKQIFKNIKISTFSELIGVEELLVLEITSNMIREDRLSALVDDVDKVIQFDLAKNSTSLKSWNQYITETCLLLDDIVAKIDVK